MHSSCPQVWLLVLHELRSCRGARQFSCVDQELFLGGHWPLLRSYGKEFVKLWAKPGSPTVTHPCGPQKAHARLGSLQGHGATHVSLRRSVC